MMLPCLSILSADIGGGILKIMLLPSLKNYYVVNQIGEVTYNLWSRKTRGNGQNIYPWYALLAISLPGIIIIFVARFFYQKISFNICRILLAQVTNRLRISRNAFLRLSEGDVVVRDRRGRRSALFSLLSSMKENVMMLLAVHSPSYFVLFLPLIGGEKEYYIRILSLRHFVFGPQWMKAEEFSWWKTDCIK